TRTVRVSTSLGLRARTVAISSWTTAWELSRKWIVARSRNPSPLGVIVVRRRLSPAKGWPPFVREMSVTVASVAFAAAGASAKARRASGRQTRASASRVEVKNEVAMRPPSKAAAMAGSSPTNRRLTGGVQRGQTVLQRLHARLSGPRPARGLRRDRSTPTGRTEAAGRARSAPDRGAAARVDGPADRRPLGRGAPSDGRDLA